MVKAASVFVRVFIAVVLPAFDCLPLPSGDKEHYSDESGIARAIPGNQPASVAFASHHKTGTVLLTQLARCWGAKLGCETMITRFNRHDPNFDGKCSTFRLGCLDSKFYGNFVQTFNNYKMVHLVRDPLDTVISGYWYHKHSHDTQLLSGTGPDILQKRSLLQGLIIEAHAELHATLKEEIDAVRAMSSDSRVLTIGLEDFVDDYNGTVARIYEFVYPNDSHLEQMTYIDKAQSADKSTDTVQMPGHINSHENYDLAVASIRDSNDTVWDEVRAVRSLLDYVEVSPGIWRYRPPTEYGLLSAHSNTVSRRIRSASSTFAACAHIQ